MLRPSGDTIAPPEFMKADAYEYMGSAPLATARYTDPGFFQRELKAMWPNVWQFAARDEELPDPGDVVVYENAGRSYLVTRQADGSVRKDRRRQNIDARALVLDRERHAFGDVS